MILSLPVDQWPEPDRAAWAAARAAAGFLEEDRPTSHWSPARCRIVEQSCGQWLAWLDRQGLLQGSPAARATEERLRAFVLDLQARVAPVSVAMMVGALLRALNVIAPEGDWCALARVYRRLKGTAAPSRDKLARMVSATDLFALGLHLMQTWDSPAKPIYRATRYRDGLLIALLISCPMRLKNFASLVIGQHLVFTDGGYELSLTGEETKTRRPYHAAVAPELSPQYRLLVECRPKILQAIGTRRGQMGGGGDHLWLDRWGRPMRSSAIRNQIESRTRDAFGKPVWPHLFRDCAVTELVDSAPEEIGLAPDLLGHADLGTTQKHYIQAKGMVAHTRVQGLIALRRAAARDSTWTSGA